MTDVPLDRLSFSRASALNQCGERFRLSYVWKVPQQPGWALIGGSAFHNITETIDLNEHGVPTKVPTIAEALDAELERSLNDGQWTVDQVRASGRASKTWPDKENRAWWEANLPGMLDAYARWKQVTPWRIWESPDGPAIELKVNIVLGEGPNKVDIVGYIDRVYENPATGDLIVVDLKSGSRKQASSHQLGLYGLGIWQKYGMLAKWGTFYDARSGSTGEVYDLGEWSEDRFEWEYGAQKAKIRQGLFTPNVSDACSWCFVKDFCYAVGGVNADQIRKPWESHDEFEKRSAA